jgi:general transcription factor IIIA
MERVHGILEFFCPECIVPDSFSLDGGPLHLGFTTNASLQAHIKKDHANCPFCDKKCASKRELDKHVESQHSGIPVEQRKIKSCSHLGCTKTFTKTANLNAHIRAVHEGQRYICGTFDVIKTADLASWDGENACGEALVSKANLEDHIRTAHLGLRSLINSRRKRRSSEAEDDSEAPPRAKKGKKSKPSALEELLGVTPEADDHRNISCIVPDCPKKFIREHDLQNHIRTKHRPASREVQDQDDIGAGVKIKLESSDIDDRDEEDRVQRDLMDDQADLDWELQTHASEGGQFWVGAGDFVAEEDQWVLDEAEMRRLIDEAVLRRNLS